MLRDPKEIRTRLTEIRNAQSDLYEKYDAQRRKLLKEVVALQHECPHTETKHHPDPSGNNDSWTECLICGMEVV